MKTYTGNVIAAINGVSKEICGVGNQMGMTANQVLTAIMQGNNAIATQLAECCCKTNNNITAMDGNIKLAMCQQTGTLQNAINNVAVGQERAASSLAYATKDQSCELKNAIKESTLTIVNGQKQQEMREMQNKIDALREENSTFKASAMTSQIVGQAVAPINQVLAGLQNEVASIKCKLPETVTTPYSPFTAVPNCVAYQAGLYGLNAANGAGLLQKKRVNLLTHPSSLSIRFTPHTLAPHTPSYAYLRKPWLLGMCQTLLRWHSLMGIPQHCHLPL